MATTIDAIVAKVESYIGEFLMSRDQLLEVGKRIDAGISAAQGSGQVKIGDKVYTLAELSGLKSENEDLLARNATIQSDYLDFKSKVADFKAALTPETESPFPPDYFAVSGEGMGVVQIAVPAGALVAAGAVLAGAILLYLSQFRSHIAKVAGSVWSDLWWLAALGIGAYLYINRRK